MLAKTTACWPSITVRLPLAKLTPPETVQSVPMTATGNGTANKCVWSCGPPEDREAESAYAPAAEMAAREYL